MEPEVEALVTVLYAELERQSREDSMMYLGALSDWGQTREAVIDGDIDLVALAGAVLKALATQPLLAGE